MAQVDPNKAMANYGKLVARAWRDPAFKAKLIDDPTSVLKDFGLSIPEGVTMKVVEATEKEFYFVLPPKPTGALSDEALDQVSGGGVRMLCFCGID
jgi:hypothetical protein